MNVVIRISLSEEGQKANLLAGGNGRSCQDVVVGRDDPSYAAVVAAGKIKYGRREHTSEYEDACVLEVEGRWDHILTPAEALEAPAVLKAERDRERREATARVLNDRRTTYERKRSGPCASNNAYKVLRPCWPEDPDPEITESPEAKEWLRELDAQNAAAQAEAEAKDAAARQATVSP